MIQSLRTFLLLALFLFGHARAQDVSVGLELDDGRVYRANLKTVESRHWARFERRIGGDQPTTEKIMGAREHVQPFAGGKLVTLQLNNGTLDRDGTGKLFCKGVVRFKKLWIDVRSRTGQVGVWEDGHAGTQRVLYEGPDIPWPQRKVVTSRFAIANSAQAGRDALTFKDRTSWATMAPDGTYGPGKFPVREATTAEDESKRAMYAAALQAYATGQPAPNIRLYSAKVGPWMPPGYSDVMEPGGTDIEVYPDPGSRHAALFALQMHARWQDRARDCLYDSSGRQLTALSFPGPIENVQISYASPVEGGALELPFFTVGSYPDFTYRWFNGGPKASDGPVWEFKHEATSHSIRTTRHGVFAYAYTNDPSVREDLLQQFESRRLAEYSDHPNAVTVNPWDPSPGAWVPPSLTKLAYDAAKNPHAGSGVDRAFGWMMHHGAVMNWMGVNRSAWLNKAVDTFELLAMLDNGVVHTNVMIQPWIPSQYRGEQTFHSLIQQHGYYCATKVLGRPAPVLPTFCAAHFDNPGNPPEPYLYNAAMLGVPWWHATYDGPNRVPLHGSTAWGNSPTAKGDIQFNLHVLALCYRATNDARWLNVALRYHVPHATVQQRKAWLETFPEPNYVGLARETYKAAVPSEL